MSEDFEIARQFIGKALATDGERSLAASLGAMISLGLGRQVFEGLPYTDLDSVVFEMPLRSGRADLVVFHVDGSASVVEIKDGCRGWRDVVAGIGQVGYYATQLSVASPVKAVRRALMWSRLENAEDNRLVVAACREAGVVPLAAMGAHHLMAAALVASLLVEGA